MVIAAVAQEPGESVVLVYNSRVPASKTVADHYARARKVPQSHIVALDLPESEIISRDDFESRLQLPLWQEMRARKMLVYGENDKDTNRCNVVHATVRNAVLCYGVPLKIAPDPERKEEAAEKFPQELRRNEAAVDSELALLPYLDHKLLLAGFLPNPFYLMTNKDLMTPTNGVLLVARVDGPTPEIAKGLVDKAIEAEKNGLWGRAYFDLRGITNGPYKPGEEWISYAADAARSYGFEVVTDNSGATFGPAAPLSDIALYFGWYDQSVSGPFTNGMAQFRPGAIAYHLHSFSSRALRVTDTWWTGPLLAAGATATMGCTEEPYLQATPHVNAFLSRFLFLGFSFGEAAYACQPYLSWQNTIVGDPLYRPFAKPQKDRFEEMSARNDTNLEWSVLMWANIRLSKGAPLEEIEELYRNTPVSKTSSVLQEKLADLYNSLGKVLQAAEHYRSALKLPMSALQRIRVSLNAAPLFASLGAPEEAYAIYQKLIREHPDYADRKQIYERMARVAQELNKPAEAEEYERLSKQGS